MQELWWKNWIIVPRRKTIPNIWRMPKDPNTQTLENGKLKQNVQNNNKKQKYFMPLNQTSIYLNKKPNKASFKFSILITEINVTSVNRVTIYKIQTNNVQTKPRSPLKYWEARIRPCKNALMNAPFCALMRDRSTRSMSISSDTHTHTQHTHNIINLSITYYKPFNSLKIAFNVSRSNQANRMRWSWYVKRGAFPTNTVRKLVLKFANLKQSSVLLLLCHGRSFNRYLNFARLKMPL